MTNLNMITCTQADVAALRDHSTAEITDRLAAMQHQESTSFCPTDYLNGHDFSTGFQEEHRVSREKMCAWCHHLVDMTELSRLTVSRAMNCLDRFLATSHKRAQLALHDRQDYQLAAMTSLYICLKIHESTPVEASLLAEISEGCYITEDILDMERCMLEALEWRVNGPTPQEFVSNILGLATTEIVEHDLDTLGSLLDVSLFQCELAAIDYDLSMCKPSIIALASVLNSLDGMMDAEEASTDECTFLVRVCHVIAGNVYMSEVELAQARLRRMVRQNSGEDEMLQETTFTTYEEYEPESHEGSNHIMETPESSPNSIKKTIDKISSPVSAAARF